MTHKLPFTLKRIIRIAVATLLILPALAACAKPSPTATPAPTATPRPTATSAPTETPKATDTPLPQPTATPGPIEVTELMVMQPWGGDGLRPQFTVSSEVEGTCWMGSITAARTDAWRCSAALQESDEILDPCIINPFDPGGTLACVHLDRTVTLLNLTQPLPVAFANAESHKRLPPSLVLADGNECDLVTGTTITVGSERLNYSCRSGGVLVGEPDKSGDVWTIAYSASERPASSEDLTEVRVARAVAFRGDTARVSSEIMGTPSGVLADVRNAQHPGFHRIVFEFGQGGLPSYDVQYTEETPREGGSGKEVPVGGEFLLRLWFFPARRVLLDDSGVTPTYTGPLRIPIDGNPNLKETVFVSDFEADMFWYVGLDQISGFLVTKLLDPPRLAIDIFDPVPGTSNRPVLHIGDRGQPVHALQEKLVAAGYLSAIPVEFVYDEDTHRAVVAFETDHGMIPDGVVGPEMWASLDRPVPPTQ